jgi:hypothetical protein
MQHLWAIMYEMYVTRQNTRAEARSQSDDVVPSWMTVQRQHTTLH